MPRRLLAALLAGSLLASPAQAQVAARAPVASVQQASATDFQRAADRVIALLEGVAEQPGAPPAMAVVLVRRGQAPVVWVRGRLKADDDAPATADTPFYIASQTKAFVGLMAVRLDAEGVFALDRPLSAVWPDLVLPDGADPHTITFRDLLSHQGNIENDALRFRTSYTDAVPAAEYGSILSRGSTARAPGYDYSNLGYLIYGAALELETGRDWRDTLETTILQPLGMHHSGPWPSLMGSLLPDYHRWMGDDGWDQFGGKPDELMHAAGGLNVSPSDMARWLQAQVGEPGAGLDPTWVRASQTFQVGADTTTDGLSCQGYGLGWQICRVGSVDIRAHGGSYTGVRSAMGVSSDLGVGIAFLSNSDSLTGGLGHMLVKGFFEMVQDPQAEFPASESYALQYADRMSRFGNGRMARVAENRSRSLWGGWSWQPRPNDVEAYIGSYRHPTMGTFRVTQESSGLRARLGVLVLELEPAAPDLFGASDGLAAPPGTVRFERVDGRTTALLWNDERFVRAD
jgi:CubicO group peptidase (beta-lactamase class C family)